MPLDVLKIGKISANSDDCFVVDFVHTINVVEAGQRPVGDQLIGSNHHTVGKLEPYHGRSRRNRGAAEETLPTS